MCENEAEKAWALLSLRDSNEYGDKAGEEEWWGIKEDKLQEWI